MTDKLKEYAATKSTFTEAFEAGFKFGVSFAEWASVKGWHFDEDHEGDDVWTQWNLSEEKLAYVETKTTPELTELFLNDKMKEK